MDPSRPLKSLLVYRVEMLQKVKVKQEERLLLACRFPDHSYDCMNVDNLYSDEHVKLPATDEKLQS